jgi:hypothetical protein
MNDPTISATHSDPDDRATEIDFDGRRYAAPPNDALQKANRQPSTDSVHSLLFW